MRPVIAFLGVILFIGLPVTIASPRLMLEDDCDPYYDWEKCEAFTVWGSSGEMSCFAACNEGCSSEVQVNTNFNHEGLTCSCDIIGPPTFCCKAAWCEADADFEAVGQCGGDCGEGPCTVVTLFDDEVPFTQVGLCACGEGE